VDGKWQHDPLAPVVASGLGSLNNLLNIAPTNGAHGGGGSPGTGFEDFSGGVDEGIVAFARGTPPGEYSQSIPAFDEADVAPLLPPHLKEATLNSEPLRNDPSELPVPNHVVLDHLYAQSVKDSVLVLGATQRYRRKFITTVLHKPLN
jgi:5'-AMP-activated protein kinase regulatory beta subunit